MSLSTDQLERRRRIWHECLAQVEPDERERIRESLQGQESLSLAVTVELLAMAEEIEGKTWQQIAQKQP
jgi:hypothetical protein